MFDRAVVFYQEHRDAAGQLVHCFDVRYGSAALPGGAVVCAFVVDNKGMTFLLEAEMYFATEGEERAYEIALAQAINAVKAG